MRYGSKLENVYHNTNLVRALVLVAILLCLGIGGYHFAFGYDIVDAIYMTVITIGTVGFGEVHPLDDGGKIFTSFLILFSIFLFAYAVTTISAYLVSINSPKSLKAKRMQQKIQYLNNHIILCGYGRNGKQAAAKLQAYNRDFVIIEHNKEVIEVLDNENLLYIEGNGTEDEVLTQAGIANATHLITTLPSDSDNVFITLTAKQLNPNIIIYSRASEESSCKKLKIAGAQNVIMPDKIGGDHIASLIVSPDLIEFLDNLSSSNTGKMNIQEIIISPHHHLNKIGDLLISEKTGCTVIGYKSGKGEYIINPGLDFAVEPNGRIIVLGNDNQIAKLNKLFDLK
jgi:voltage-gated potassium channel